MESPPPTQQMKIQAQISWVGQSTNGDLNHGDVDLGNLNHGELDLANVDHGDWGWPVSGLSTADRSFIIYGWSMLSDIHKVSISQQLSGVIAFDIAVVAQKVKVANEDWCDLKKVGCWVSSRSG